MGVSGSILAFVFGVDGIVVGVIAAWSDTLPMLIAALCLLLTGIVTLFMFKPAYAYTPKMHG